MSMRVPFILTFLFVFSGCPSIPELPTELIHWQNSKDMKYLAFPTPCAVHSTHLLRVWYLECLEKGDGIVRTKHAHILKIRLDACSAGDRSVLFSKQMEKLLLPLYIGKEKGHAHKKRLLGDMYIYVPKAEPK